MQAYWIHIVAFWYRLGWVEYSLLIALGVCWAYQLYFYLRYVACALLRSKDVKEEFTPGVSVIVCAKNEQDNLERYLQVLCSQDYPEYEVIVVNDGSLDDTQPIIERYMAHEHKLRMSFVPQEARMGSTKKLAITLGAKAARYDYLLLTDADCCPASRHWIRHMVAPFQNPKTDIVLGYGGYFDDKGLLNRIVQSETLMNGMHYLGAARTHRPYMGVGRNVAYRKQMFFESGGFTHMMHERSGDDDLFVNRVANRTNTAIVFEAAATTWSPAKQLWKDWWQQRRRHISVSPNYKLATKLRLGFEPISRLLFFLLVGAVAWLCGPIGWAVATVALLSRWLLQRGLLKAGAKRVGQRKANGILLTNELLLPLLNLYILLTPRKSKLRW